MSRGPAALVGCVLALLGVVSLAGCAAADVRTAEGLIVDVVSTSPADVQSFTLRTSTGEVLRFSIGQLDLAQGGFPPAHLREHQALTEPIRVTYRQEGDRLVAVRLEDAG